MATINEYRIEAVDRTNTSVGVSIQNPSDRREMDKIPITMKYYPKGMVWVSRNGSTDEPVRIQDENGGLLDTQNDYGKQRLVGGMFVDQSQQ